MLELARRAQKVFDILINFFSFKLPHLLIWVAFIYLGVIKLPQAFFNDGEFVTVLPVYLSAVGLCIALASVVFTYASKTDESQNLVRVGELFLYSSVSLISSLIISWLSFEISSYIKSIELPSIVLGMVNTLFVSGLLFLIFATTSISKGIERLEVYLFLKIRNDIK